MTSRTVVKPPLPELLPGEDRAFGAGLFVDLIPESCWFTSARAFIAASDWQRVRTMVIQRANSRCEACGIWKDTKQLSVHERWQYFEATHPMSGERRYLQSLTRLLSICRMCHLATHMGFAGTIGKEEAARAHLSRVLALGGNNDALKEHINDAFALYEWRSQFAWELDLHVLTDAGIEIKFPNNGRKLI